MSVELELANMSFDVETFKEQLEQIEAVTHLRLHLNLNFTIIKEITIYSQTLSQLQFLNLGYNKIVNLQALAKMSLLHLKELHLFSNNISSVRPLKKCSLPKLKFISLGLTSTIQPIIIYLHCREQVNGTVLSLSRWQHVRLLYPDDNRISYIPSLLRTNFNGLRSICFGDEVDQNLLFIGCLLARFINYQNYDQIELLSDSDTSVD